MFLGLKTNFCTFNRFSDLVLGVVRERKLSRLPRNKCSYVGHSNASAVEVARKFNETWDTNLRIGHHDCRDYTNGW